VPDRKELDAELDKGRLEELPPNIPPGFLGEVTPNLRKPDSFRPTLSAGIIQEATAETRWLTIAVLYVLVFTSPIAAWLLWRDRSRSLASKIFASVVMVAGLVVLFILYRR
jgi:hypothetical protein